MAYVSVNPVSGSLIARGDIITITVDSQNYPLIGYRTTGGGPDEIISSGTGTWATIGAGYTGGYGVDGANYTVTFSRDAGWPTDNFNISVFFDSTGIETILNFIVLGAGQYPPDMQPFGDPSESVSSGFVSVQDNGISQGDADTLNFANNLTVTFDGTIATVVGESGGAGSGDVVSSETSGTVLDEELVVFDGTTGKLVKGSGDRILANATQGILQAETLIANEDLYINNGSILVQGFNQGLNMKQGGGAQSPLPGRGTYWVRQEATSNSPHFSDDTDTEYDLRGGTVSDGNTSTTLITDGVLFGSTASVPAVYSLAPESKDSSFNADSIYIAGGGNIGTGEGGDVDIVGGVGSGSGVSGHVSVGLYNTATVFVGGFGAQVRINDGTGLGTSGYGLISDGTKASWQPNPGGGTTDTIVGSDGITNTGDNTDAILTPTYGQSANTITQGNDSRLSDARDPNVHASSHENGSGDEISVAGLSGLLADVQKIGVEGDDDVTEIKAGSNLTISVDAPNGTATLNASVSGSAGVNGLGSWNYDNTLTSADPGSGNFRLDNLNPNSATEMYIDSVNGDSQTMDTVLANTEGWRLSFNNASGAKYFTAICGEPTDETGWWTIPLSDAYGTTTLTNTENHTVTLAPSDGFVSAGAAISDNAIVRGDGGASGVQDSSITITDGGAVVLTSATSMVQVQERTTGPTFAAGAGQYWVKDTAPGTAPFFTDEDGTELDLTPTTIGTDSDAIHVDVSDEISWITEKTTPVAADLLVIEDSAASNAKKRVQIGNLPFVADEAQRLVVDARSSAGTINPGQAIYLTGWNATEGVIEVDLADASAAATMPCFGIAEGTITSAVTGQVIVSGDIPGQVTTGYTEGDFLYVSETAGALTDTKPTGTAVVQHVGVVNRAHATLGVIQVVGASLETGLPNISEDTVWMGNASGVPTETARAGIDTDATAHFLLTDNPHETSLANLEGGTHSDLERASIDSGKIFASWQEDQVAGLTAEASPAATDLFIMERAIDGVYRAVERQNLVTIPRQTRPITIEDPTSSENVSIFYTTVAITVTQITAVIQGSNSVTFDIQHGTSRDTATGTGVIGTDEVADSTTTGNITTSFADADIPADSFVWLTTSEISGTPDELNVTIEYTED